jgi:hypothetical protein
LEISHHFDPFSWWFGADRQALQRLVANSLFSQKQGMFLVVTGNSVSETGKLQDLAAEKPSGIGFAAHP